MCDCVRVLVQIAHCQIVTPEKVGDVRLKKFGSLDKLPTRLAARPPIFTARLQMFLQSQASYITLSLTHTNHGANIYQSIPSSRQHRPPEEPSSSEKGDMVFIIEQRLKRQAIA